MKSDSQIEPEDRLVMGIIMACVGLLLCGLALFAHVSILAVIGLYCFAIAALDALRWKRAVS